jgi:transcriptional regulator with XRE-family HTH domain
MVAKKYNIGPRIKQRREELNISQERLGELTGVSYQQIQKYEKGINKVSAERLSIIAEHLMVPVSFFFESTEDFHVREEREDGNYFIQGKKALSHQEKDLLKFFRSLPDEDARSNLIGFLNSVCKKKKGS